MAEQRPPHTPGRWYPGRDDTLSYHGDGDGPFKNVYVDDPHGRMHMGERLPEIVATVYGPLGADPRDNARLVAASPALHDSLLDLLAALEQLEVIDWPALACEVAAAQAALAAATGKPSPGGTP